MHIFYLFFFRLADIVGFGIALTSGKQYLENFKSMVAPLMIDDKRRGPVYHVYNDGTY